MRDFTYTQKAVGVWSQQAPDQAGPHIRYEIRLKRCRLHGLSEEPCLTLFPANTWLIIFCIIPAAKDGISVPLYDLGWISRRSSP